MIWNQGQSFRRIILLGSLLSTTSLTVQAQKWIEPTQEELKMTSQPEVPGAAAVYLNREETTNDKLHYFAIYVRLKVLTDKGKDYSNVELSYANRSGGGGYTVNDIAGRTIHPDGKVIPFTGKPYEKLIEKNQNEKHMAKVFTLPDVEVGSILEYRYMLRYDDHYFISPQWFIQSDLFTRKAHYAWKPTGEQLTSNDDRGQLTNTIAWTPILPKGAELKESRIVGEGTLQFELDVQNIPPAPNEELMPPISSLTYRVLFYYSPYKSNAEFWKDEGKHWSKVHDKFIGPDAGVKAAVRDLVASGDTEDQKLRKIYAFVMKMENTDFTHDHSAAEEKSQGFKEVKNADDILARKRGDGDQLTLLFISMARAAGMKAYLMTVTNRDRHLFLQNFFTLSQLDDNIAFVNVGGKELPFDPGSRYCPYGQLAWKHTMAGGLRQTEAGAQVAVSPPQSLVMSQILRLANLTMDAQGQVAGKVTMTYVGSPALSLRQLALRQDETALEQSLKTRMERLLPGGMEVKVTSVGSVADYEKPLVVDYQIKGGIGSSTGKRILLPGDIFEVNSKPAFSHEKRETAVAFDYPHIVKDAVRINFPVGFTIESLPTNDKFPYERFAAYSLSTESSPTSVTFRREFDLGEILYLPNDYPALRNFYGKFESKDQENVVLKIASTTSGN